MVESIASNFRSMPSLRAASELKCGSSSGIRFSKWVHWPTTRDGSPVIDGGCREARGIEAPAHGDADLARRQTIGNGSRQQFAETFAVASRVPAVDRLRDLEPPITARCDTCS